MSTALEVSKKMLHDISLFSKEVIRLSASAKIACVVFLLGINPN